MVLIWNIKTDCLNTELAPEQRAHPVNLPLSNRKRTDGFPSRLPLARKFGLHSTTLRFLTPDDALKLLAFFSSHTPDTIYSRYGSFVGMSPEHAAQLVGVNQSRDCALGVFEGHAQVLIAIGRYCLDDSGDSAEVAFVMRENRRGLGIATALLRELRAIAHERGLTRLTASGSRQSRHAGNLSTHWRCSNGPWLWRRHQRYPGTGQQFPAQIPLIISSRLSTISRRSKAHENIDPPRADDEAPGK